MAKNPIITTPFGVANYPHLTKPDTEGKFATGKYSTKLNLSKEDMAKFKAEFTKAVGSIPKGYKVPWGEKDGQEYLTAKSQFKPIIEVENGSLEEGQYIGGGSKIKLACEIYDYDKGFTLRLKAVKVKELVSGGGGYFRDEDDSEEEGETSGSLDI